MRLQRHLKIENTLLTGSRIYLDRWEGVVAEAEEVEEGLAIEEEYGWMAIL